jgi:hypothetical protein
MLNGLTSFAGQVLWLLWCLPGWVRFQSALRHPRRAQEQRLRRLLRASQHTDFGRRHDFASVRSFEEFAARVPLAEYDDFADAIAAARKGERFGLAAETPELLEPTSGSSGRPKLVPITSALRREFTAAVQPWIAWLYLAHPRLLLGRQYWAISPNTPVPAEEGGVAAAIPTGFADDAEHLGFVARWLSRAVLCTPPELCRVADPDSFTRLTLIFLLREKNLRLISVWHPSFLTLLLDAIPRHAPDVLEALRTGRVPEHCVLSTELRDRIGARLRPERRRADELAGLELGRHPERVGEVWPRLQVVSCWEGSRSEPWLGRLRALFPRAVVQSKGLLATEGCVTIPTGCGRLHPCAVRSHVLEFIPANGATALPVWALERGREYSVVLTTGGGLWRYRLHDVVRVTGFCGATPCLEFLGKDNSVSDLVGEKLADRQVAEALEDATTTLGVRPAFAMLVPEPAGSDAALCGYRLLLELESAAGQPDAAPEFARCVERGLNRNYHYAHARRLGQIRAVQATVVRNGMDAYLAVRDALGARRGTVKIPALELGRSLRPDWWKFASAEHPAVASTQ